MNGAMKLLFRLLFIVIPVSILTLPVEAAGVEPSFGAPPRVTVSLVLLEAPSGVQTTTDLDSLGTVITHQSQLTPGGNVYLEAWCQTPGPNGISQAIVDLEYPTTLLDTSVEQVSLAQQWDHYQYLPAVDEEVGMVDDLGGVYFFRPGLGIAEWARIGTVEFDVIGTPGHPVDFCSLVAGNVCPGPQCLWFTIISEGLVPPDEVEYGCFMVGCNVDADCDDGNACTDDSCDPDLGCLHSAVDCDDGNICTVDTCDPETGCDNDGTGVAIGCNDNNACTTSDVCQGDAAGTCQGTDTSGVDCDDGNVCTVDTCDPVTGCDNDGTGVTIGCDDNNACTTNDVCQGDAAGTCEGTDTSAVDCDDGNVCTVDTCDPESGCIHVSLECDDGDPCTDDTCDPEIGCVYTPVGGYPERIVVEIPELVGVYDWVTQHDAEVSLGFSLFDIGCVAIQWSGWINTGTFDCNGTLEGLGGQFVATFIPESFAEASFEELDEHANFTISFERTDPVHLETGGTFDFLLDGSADIRVSFPPYFQKCLIVYSPIGMLSSLSLVMAAHRMHDFDADGAVELDDMNGFHSCMGGPDDQLTTGCEIFDSDRDTDVDLADFATFQVAFTGEPQAS